MTVERAGDVVVRHAGGSYPVLIGAGLLEELPALARRFLGGARLAAIGDATVAGLHGARIAPPAELFTFPAGEAHKTRETWARLSDALLAAGFGRDGAIVALGGGVTGDVAGFVAATYMRGVPVLQVPTTLLAMVDAAVGGKTGVDTPLGKNLVGAFHHPVAVVADPRVLATLPARELRAGLAEAVKHGLVADAGHLDWLEARAPAILARDEATLAALVRRSVEIKAEVVGSDEREAGRRAVLNAGHTVAHALEHASGWALLHGEAVALGLVAETALAERLGVAEPGLGRRVERALTALGLPVRLPEGIDAAPDRLLEAMTRDKKNRAAGEVAGAIRAGALRAGALRFSLPRRAGEMEPGADGRWTVAADPGTVRDALAVLGGPAPAGNGP
jgi:3-dehydroquinate synthase